MGSIEWQKSSLQTEITTEAAVAGYQYYFEIEKFDFETYGHFKTKFTSLNSGFVTVNFGCFREVNFIKSSFTSSGMNQPQVVLGFRLDFVGSSFDLRVEVARYLG